MISYREFLNSGTPNTYLEAIDVQELEVLEKIRDPLFCTFKQGPEDTAKPHLASELITEDPHFQSCMDIWEKVSCRNYGKNLRSKENIHNINVQRREINKSEKQEAPHDLVCYSHYNSPVHPSCLSLTGEDETSGGVRAGAPDMNKKKVVWHVALYYYTILV